MEQLNSFRAMAIEQTETPRKMIAQFIRNQTKFLKKCAIQFARIFWLFLKEFCGRSNIHGVRYFTEHLQHWSERLWWIIAFGLSLWLSFSMMHNIWVDWQKHPMTMSTIKENLPVSKIPFPTVTICPYITVRKNKFDVSSRVDPKLRLLPKLPYTDMMRMSELIHVCSQLRHYKVLQHKFSNDSFVNIIEDVAPNLEETVRSCSWQRNQINLSENFVTDYTYDGVCFSFNALSSHDTYTDEMASKLILGNNNVPNVSNWNLENGYDESTDGIEYPIRAFDTGQNAALDIDLVLDIRDFDGICRTSHLGFLILLSMPGEPSNLLFDWRSKQLTYVMSFAEDTHIRIFPKLTTTSDGLRNYSPSQRKCFYQSERRLRFFKMYTQRNCEAECLTNFTKHQCGCVHFSMPRDESTKVCGGASIECYVLVRDKFQFNCNCLPACIYTDYLVDIESVKNHNRTDNMNSSMEEEKLIIFFDDNQIEAKQRVETRNLAEFLSLCGGLLGIFLGVSFCSIIELIYFATIRLFWLIRRPEPEGDTLFSEQRTKVLTIYDQMMQNRNQTPKPIKRFLQSMRILFTEYCDNSSIHGVRYFTKRRLHWSERCWWIITFGVLLCLCGSMVGNIWVQWQKSPMTMRFNENEIPITAIPLPTVTICPEIKTFKNKLNITSAIDSLHNLTRIEAERLNALSHVCTRLPNFIEFKDKFSNESIYDTIQNIAPKYQNTIQFCQKTLNSCPKNITPVLTDEGLCFAFNALNSHEIYTDEMAPGMMIVKNNPNISYWNFENGYDRGSHKYEYPARVVDSIPAFRIHLMTSDINLEERCRGFDKGFKVVLTAPGEMVKVSSNHFGLYPSKYNYIKIVPKLTRTSNGLRKYSPNKRGCFFQSERQLRFFKYYTQFNCETECLANFTKDHCGCVKFSMPRDKNTKICGGASIDCYKTANKKFMINNRTVSFRDTCNCLPACTSIEYKAIDSRCEFLSFKESLRKETVLTFHFFNYHLDMLKRIETYTYFDFLATCGGLLGLFLGISLLSIIEFIYYFTLRLCWTVRQLTSPATILAIPLKPRRIDVIPFEDNNE